MPRNTYLQIACTLLLMASSLSIQAATITVVDRNNKPIPNLIVGFDSHSSVSNATVNNIAVMDQVDAQFQPEVLLISKGQWVDFPNSDNVRHHVYSFSSPKPFEIKMFSGSEADAIQFDKSGLVVLGCNIHDSMIGYIYVSDQEVTKISDSTGKVELLSTDLVNIDRGATNSSTVSATLWHPLLSATNTKRIDVQIDLSLHEQTISIDMQQKPSNVEQKSKGFSSKFKKKS